jgi:hypothetical protein
MLKSAISRGDSAQSLHSRVVAFQTVDELRPFVGDGVGGFYTSSFTTASGSEPLLVIAEEMSPFARTLFAHELAHRITVQQLGQLRPWLAEGLAQYYSTIRAEAGKPVVGEPDPENVVAPGSSVSSPGDVVVQGQVLHISELPLASQLIAYLAQDFYAAQSESQTQLSYEQRQTRARNYAASWMLVHMLLHAKSSYATQFRELYGQPGRGGDALQQLLASVPAETLNQDLQTYMAQSMSWRRRYLNLAAAPGELQQRPMTDSEVLSLWQALRSLRHQG